MTTVSKWSFFSLQSICILIVKYKYKWNRNFSLGKVVGEQKVQIKLEKK